MCSLIGAVRAKVSLVVVNTEYAGLVSSKSSAVTLNEFTLWQVLFGISFWLNGYSLVNL